ncbi:CHAT domain-containing protein [Mesorhizobium sp. M0047]
MFFANDDEIQGSYLRKLEAEADALAEAMRRAEALDLCRFFEERQATASRIFDSFADPANRDHVAVFHYAGHANSFQLLLRSAEGGLRAADRRGFAEYLGQQKSLRLVFLNGCSTRMHVEDLLVAGVDAVIATDRAVADQTATDFATRFYRNFGSGASIGTAFAEAVAAVKTEHGANPRHMYHPDQVEWSADRWPWSLHLRPGAIDAANWSLPVAVGDPLFSLPQPAPRELPDRPFRHLQSYSEEHAELFSGRADEIRFLYDWLGGPDRAQLMLVTGQSGAGKSSVLQAGLLPRLRAFLPRFVVCDSGLGMAGSLANALAGTSAIALEDAWRVAEESALPVLGVLDQMDRALAGADERQSGALPTFLDDLSKLFGARDRPRGRLILAFRKEYLADIEAGLVQRSIPFETFSIHDLSRRGVVDIVNSAARTDRLRSAYKLSIDPALPDRMAEYVLSDAVSNVTPLLQVQLSRMWDDTQEAPTGARHFSVELFRDLIDRQRFLHDFFDEQIDHLRREVPEAVRTGLVLDLLEYFTNTNGTARDRTETELGANYGHSIFSLVQKLSGLYFLVACTHAGLPANRLAHDVIASYVRGRFEESQSPGQRARRILEARMRPIDASSPDALRPLSERDLELVELGLPGMRLPTPDQVKLIEGSKEARRTSRLRRIGVAFGAAAAVLLIVVLGFVAWVTGQQEEYQRQAAMIRALAQRALRDAPQYNRASILIAEEAFELSRRAKGAGMLEVGDVLRQILSQPYHLRSVDAADLSVVSARSDSAERRAVLVERDGGLGVFDIEERRTFRLAQIEGEENVTADIHPSGTMIASAAKGGKVYLRTGNTFDHVETLLDDKQVELTAIAFSIDGSALLAGDGQGGFIEWVAKKATSPAFAAPERLDVGWPPELKVPRVTAIASAKDGFYVGGGDKVLFIARSDPKQVFEVCRLPDRGEVSALAIDATSGNPVVGTFSGSVQQCDRAGPHIMHEVLPSRASAVVGIVSESNPPRLLISTQNHGTTLYATSEGVESNLGGDGLQVLASLAKRHSLLVAKSGTMALLEAADVLSLSQAILMRDGHDRGQSETLSYLAFGRNNNLLIAGALQEVPNALRLWDISGTNARELPPVPQSVHVMSAYVPPDASHVFTIDPYSVVREWSLADYHERLLRPGTSGVGWSLAVDPTGDTLAVSVDDSRLELIDRASGRRRQIDSTGLGVTTRAVGFSPWNMDVISGDDEGMLRFWRRDGSGQSRAPIHLSKPVMSLAVDAGSGLLAVGAGSTVYLLRKTSDVSVSAELPMLSTAMKVTFSPSGDLLAASDSDGGVLVWDLHYLDGEPIVFSNKQAWASRALALDGKGRLAAGTVNGRIILDTVDPSVLATIACTLIETSASEDWNWTEGVTALDDKSLLAPVCGGSAPK